MLVFGSLCVCLHCLLCFVFARVRWSGFCLIVADLRVGGTGLVVGVGVV